MRVTAITKFFIHILSPHKQSTVICIGSNSVVVTGFWARFINCVGLYKLYRQEKLRIWW